ncbi:nitrite/sulfite reductase domain-containing protein [Desulfogranum mediterraneum]|uniref:nitrite reductase n=1 Tax=Desulfogranum mediterraneum TaxID=160661 RepID=UPI0003FAE322|nr:nitrite reductase [Desulfogranum mediterraneum]
MTEEAKVSLTILIPAGRLPLEIMNTAQQLAGQHDLEVYLSTAQNLRLNNIPEGVLEEVKSTLAAVGSEFKAPGKFLLPRVCVGKDHCKFGLVDTRAVSDTILKRFADRAHTKGKVKLAVAACPLCCSSPKTTDIGIIATAKGFELYAGGKGGPFPKIGQRIAKEADEEQILEMIATLVEFHDQKTESKQRLVKLLDDPEFPFAEV